jgi:hypothetical protein
VFDYSHVYIAACGAPFSSYVEGKQHEQDCEECQYILEGRDYEDDESDMD